MGVPTIEVERTRIFRLDLGGWGFQRGLPRCYEVLCRPEINRIICNFRKVHESGT